MLDTNVDTKEITLLLGEETTKIPDKVFINLKPIFAPLVFTAPYLEVNLPENPSLKSQGDLSVTLKNNGRLQLNPYDPQGLRGRDWNARTTIESVSWNGEIITADKLLTDRDQLLERFFIQILGSKEAVELLRTQNEAAGLKRDSYLYRAITKDEFKEMQRDGCKYVSHLDPSANFENEKMYQNESSQVKHYAKQAEQGYSGQIIKWKIEDPLLYRTAGLAARRITPLFTHYLPRDLEISIDGGSTFEPLHPSSQQTPK